MTNLNPSAAPFVQRAWFTYEDFCRKTARLAMRGDKRGLARLKRRAWVSRLMPPAAPAERSP